MSERESHLESQCKALADRLALAIAIFADHEIDFDLERMSREDRNPWRESQELLLSDDPLWTAARNSRRKLVFYQEAKARLREWLAKGLRKAA